MCSFVVALRGKDKVSCFKTIGQEIFNSNGELTYTWSVI